AFLANICNSAWNSTIDAGTKMADAVRALKTKHPARTEWIEAYHARWEEMLRGPIDGTVEIFRTLRANPDFRLFALSNWSAETFPIAEQRYDFLRQFDGVLLSGNERL